MLFYIIVVGITLFFGAWAARYDEPVASTLKVGRFRHTRTCKSLFIISSLILIFVSGLRYYVGTDFGAYYRQYAKYADSLWTRLETLDEPGYALVASVARVLVDDGWMSIFLSSLLITGLVLATIYKHTDTIFFSLAFYIFLGAWHGSFNGTRQYMATAVLFAGLPFLLNRKFVPYCITVFLAFLCHKSAIIMVLLYFVVYREINFKNLMITILLTWIVSIAYEYLFTISSLILDDEASFNEFTLQGVSIIRIAVYSLPAIFFWLFLSRQELNKIDTFMGNLLTVFSALSIITMQSSFLQRIILYLVPFQTLAIPHMFRMIKGKTQQYASAISLILYAAFWMYDISVRSNMIPYRWIGQR
ncbi:MAG: EpsG family protein [Oscillospiraceae bacterium]|nr:EpsG family protein [Oscillospiraceae bacterium]